MDSAPSEAQALALGLEAGAVSAADVRTWADGQIRILATPGSTLIELALVKDVPKAIGLLHELGAGADTRTSARLAFGHLHRALSRNAVEPMKVAKALERMVRVGYVPAEDAESEMYMFEDQMQLATDRVYSDPNTVCQEMQAFLARYAT